MALDRSSTMIDGGAAIVGTGLASTDLILVGARASATGSAFEASAVLIRPIAVAGSAASFGRGTNRRAWANSIGATSGRVTMTRAPILVVFQSSCAKLSVSRTQPCDAG